MKVIQEVDVDAEQKANEVRDKDSSHNEEHTPRRDYMEMSVEGLKTQEPYRTHKYMLMTQKHNWPVTKRWNVCVTGQYSATYDLCELIGQVVPLFCIVHLY